MEGCEGFIDKERGGRKKCGTKKVHVAWEMVKVQSALFVRIDCFGGVVMSNNPQLIPQLFIDQQDQRMSS